jgi:hypothetical protein
VQELLAGRATALGTALHATCCMYHPAIGGHRAHQVALKGRDVAILINPSTAWGPGKWKENSTSLRSDIPIQKAHLGSCVRLPRAPAMWADASAIVPTRATPIALAWNHPTQVKAPAFLIAVALPRRSA